MKTLSHLLTLVLILLVSPMRSVSAPVQKITDWQGTVTAINETSIKVKNAKSEKAFMIYPGTVFGQRAKGALSDIKVGETVHVTFSEVGGQAKAENIRNPENDKKKPAKKKKP